MVYSHANFVSRIITYDDSQLLPLFKPTLLGNLRLGTGVLRTFQRWRNVDNRDGGGKKPGAIRGWESCHVFSRSLIHRPLFQQIV